MATGHDSVGQGQSVWKQASFQLANPENPEGPFLTTYVRCSAGAGFGLSVHGWTVTDGRHPSYLSIHSSPCTVSEQFDRLLFSCCF